MALTDEQKKQLAELKALEDGDEEEKANKKRRDWLDAQIKKDEGAAKAAEEKKKKDAEEAEKKKKRSWL